jgi:ribonuclease PH
MSEVSLKPFNTDTQKVLDTLNGKLSQKVAIQNFFGLRDSVVIAEDGKTIIEIFDDFRDPEALVAK